MQTRLRALAPHPHTKALRSLACVIAGTALLCGTAHAQQRWDVSSRDGLVTIMANAATAADLATAIGEATGVNVVVHGEPTTPLTADIVDVPLDKAIAELAPSHLLVRESAADDAEIIEVVLMMPDPASGSGGSNTNFLPSGAPTDGVVAQDAPAAAVPGTEVEAAPTDGGVQPAIPADGVELQPAPVPDATGAVQSQ